MNRSNTSSKSTRHHNQKRPTGNKNNTTSNTNTPAGSTSQIPENHPYTAVFTGTYTPQHVTAKAWKTARPVAEKLLNADYLRDPSREHSNMVGRRGALCQYLGWLAEANPELLATDPMDHDEVRFYLATETLMRRTSHRSRVALGSILKSFGVTTKKTPRNDVVPTIAPLDDQTFDLALRECAHFRSAVTRANTRALLLLSRGAGLDGVDLRYVCGDDIVRVPSAGLWVNIRNPKNTRSVPVLARFADQLEDLASGRGSKPMLAEEGNWPTNSSRPAEVAGVISRQMAKTADKTRINVQSLRKAWLAEQIAANTPLLTLLQALGTKTLATIESLVFEHAPLPSNNPAHIAYELGGMK